MRATWWRRLRISIGWRNLRIFTWGTKLPKAQLLYYWMFEENIINITQLSWSDGEKKINERIIGKFNLVSLLCIQRIKTNLTQLQFGNELFLTFTNYTHFNELIKLNRSRAVNIRRKEHSLECTRRQLNPIILLIALAYPIWTSASCNSWKSIAPLLSVSK